MIENFPYLTSDEYNDFFRPSNLFKTNTELEDFLSIRAGLTFDQYQASLTEMLRLCEEDENYEYCAIIKKFMK